ncbi:MAG TPA: thioredoxin-dependent thiol peroxidase [Solirubrobacterales bacterium]|nr:thioredoxin-dependent thiol peroxidase [Solirubrobacterales bacterium]
MTVLSEGDKAPAFALPDQNGKTVKLSDLRGETVVLYFYPRADTPGCTTQACGVRDRRADYEAAGARVIGISPDEVGAIDKFAGKYDLGFTLLADADHAVAEKYGAWVEKSMYGRKYMGVARATFIVDPKGKIARVFPKVQPKKHDDLVLKALDELAAA